MSLWDYGKTAAYRSGSLGLGVASTPIAAAGGISALYGLSKIGSEETVDLLETASAGMQGVNQILEGDLTDFDTEEIDFPEYSDQSANNLYSAAKWGAGGLILGGISALGYKKARGMW